VRLQPPRTRDLAVLRSGDTALSSGRGSKMLSACTSTSTSSDRAAATVPAFSLSLFASASSSVSGELCALSAVVPMAAATGGPLLAEASVAEASVRASPSESAAGSALACCSARRRSRRFSRLFSLLLFLLPRSLGTLLRSDTPSATRWIRFCEAVTALEARPPLEAVAGGAGPRASDSLPEGG